MSSETYLTLIEASQRFGISPPTLRKYLTSKPPKISGAYQEERGKVQVWQIPLTELQSITDKSKKTPAKLFAAETETSAVLKVLKLEEQLAQAELLVRTLERNLEDLRATQLALTSAERDNARSVERLTAALEHSYGQVIKALEQQSRERIDDLEKRIFPLLDTEKAKPKRKLFSRR
jgi:AraC-like DNA-binding protein